MHAAPLASLQVERDWQWKVESKDQEIASLTTRTRQVGGWSGLGRCWRCLYASVGDPGQAVACASWLISSLVGGW